MRRLNRVLLAVAVVAASAFTQAKPNFAGTWVRETPGNPGSGGFASWGFEPTITQTAATLKIQWLAGRDNSARDVYITRTYNLKGESKNPVIGRGGVPTAEVIVTASTWEGNKLVLTSKLYKELISIENGKLVWERTILGPVANASAAVTRVVYRRKGS